MSISIHFEIINLYNQVDYMFKLYDYYIAFTDQYISFIDISLKSVIYTSYFEMMGKPYIFQYNGKILIQWFNKLNSVYNILTLDGKKLTNLPINCKSNYLVVYNDILYSLSVINSVIYIIDPNDVVKCVIHLDFQIKWFSNPVTYTDNQVGHILIVVRNSHDLYLIIDITHNTTYISNEFSIDHNIIHDKLTIGYNNCLEIYMPSDENIILGKIENLNYIHSITNQFINGQFIDAQLIKSFKRSDNFSQILDDLKGNTKPPLYRININNWKINYPSIENDNIHKSICNKIVTSDISNISDNTKVTSLNLECISSNYIDFIQFIIDNYNTNFIDIQLYDNKYYNVIYSNIYNETYVLETFCETLDLTRYSELFDNYFFTTYSLTLSDNSLSKRYFPLSLYHNTILEKDTYFIFTPNKFTTFRVINKISELFIKLDIINIKLDFAVSPFCKISRARINNLGITYFENIRDYLRLDDELQTKLYLILNTLLNPTFNSTTPSST